MLLNRVVHSDEITFSYLYLLFKSDRKMEAQIVLAIGLNILYKIWLRWLQGAQSQIIKTGLL